jgi:hypothetical protein
MLATMLRRLTLTLLGLAAPVCAAQAAGLPCQPCAGLRLEAPPPTQLPPPPAIGVPPPAPGASGPSAHDSAAVATQPAPSPAGLPAGLLGLLRAERLAPGSPLFIAWEVPLPGTGAPGQAAVGTAAGKGQAAAAPGQAAAAPGQAATAPGTAAAERAGMPAAAAAGTAAPLPGGTEGSPQAAAGAAAGSVAASGATPWLTLVFSTPPPLARNLARLQAELGAAAEVAAAAPPGTWFQVAWRPAIPAPAPFDPAEYAFLLKRAAVALGGAQANVHVATAPLPADPAVIAALYGAEVAAYVDVVALAGDSPEGAEEGRLAAAVQKVRELDPGKPIALDGLPYPAAPAGAALAEAARHATTGFDLTLFRVAAVNAAVLNPLALLAREFAGDLSYDPGSAPAGAAESWAFVRGKDLALRVIALSPAASGGSAAAGAPAAAGTPAAAGAERATGGAPAAELVLHFPDPNLRRPTRFPFVAGPVAPPSGRITPPPNAGLDVRIPDPAPVVVLGLERLTAAERHGVGEKLTVASTREIPVEEILKRLQVFEDAQGRRLDHYTATNTTHLRFQPNAGSNSIEATLSGPFFWTRDGGADWAWESLYVNGVRWRGKTLPEIPLIQPEKAAALPLEIHFTRDYRYRLRGTEKLDGRDAWVVDFAPSGPGAAGRRLYQGTVWIDSALNARMRTRAVQIGLEGEVISNEETLFYSPIDAQGRPAPWSPDSFFLPLRLVAQQILSVLDNPTVVERETVLSGVQLNSPDFVARRQSVEASDVTMVRDTDKGLRYLVKKGNGAREVKEGFAPSKLFALAGLFVDDALNYPLPLAGVNYFTFDFKNTHKQVNVFFAGALLVASASQPRLAGSRFDLGGELFAIAVPFTDNLYLQGKEQVDEEVKVRPATFSLKLGHPLGDFVTANFEYGLLYSAYSRNSNTSSQFTLPSDNLLQSVQGGLKFSRAGYNLGATYSYNLRSSWRSWGLPGNPDFSPADRDFVKYGLRASKNWYLPKFQKLGVEIDYFSGAHLDRFSKYEFGFFGGTRVDGYRSNAVRASEAYLAHLSYGFDFGEVFRVDALADAAIASDKLDGLHHRLLAGTGVAGSMMGPWQTLVTLDVGLPVAGPDHGFVLYLVFLRLFH